MIKESVKFRLKQIFGLRLCNTAMRKKSKSSSYRTQEDQTLPKNILGFKTYEEYKDDWIYEWNKDVPWVHEKPWTDDGAWKEPLNRTGLKASLMSYLTKLKEFQFPKQPSPKQQLEPIQLMKEDLPSRKGLKAS
ncbi:hypothetical protein Tco_1408895 [Tanacetum coccineum]